MPIKMSGSFLKRAQKEWYLKSADTKSESFVAFTKNISANLSSTGVTFTTAGYILQRDLWLRWLMDPISMTYNIICKRLQTHVCRQRTGPS